MTRSNSAYQEAFDAPFDSPRIGCTAAHKHALRPLRQRHYAFASGIGERAKAPGVGCRPQFWPKTTSVPFQSSLSDRIARPLDWECPGSSRPDHRIHIFGPKACVRDKSGWKGTDLGENWCRPSPKLDEGGGKNLPGPTRHYAGQKTGPGDVARAKSKRSEGRGRLGLRLRCR